MEEEETEGEELEKEEYMKKYLLEENFESKPEKIIDSLRGKKEEKDREKRRKKRRELREQTQLKTGTQKTRII